MNKQLSRAAALLLCVLLTGCGTPLHGSIPLPDVSSGDATSADSGRAASPDSGESAPVFAAEMFTDRDRRTDYNGGIRIELSGNTATASSTGVKIDGSTVTITAENTYILCGTLEDGQIIVDAPDSAKLQLVLEGVSVHSSSSAPLYIKEADKVFLTLAPGTVNTLSSGEGFTAIDENNIDAALFAKQDLTVNGEGALSVTSPAGHGIAAKDDLVFTGGRVTVQSASHGIDANDSVRITGTSLTVDAGKDAIHVENSDDDTRGFFYMADGTLSLEAEGDGIHAGVCAQIEGGSIDILAGGGSVNGEVHSSAGFGGFMGGGRGGKTPPGGFGGMSGFGGTGGTQSSTSSEDAASMKGIKAAGDVRILGGTITVDAADDALHANGSLTVGGGTLTLSTGDDGIHAEDTLTVTAGTVRIETSYEGLEALHIAVSGGDIKLTATDDGLNAAGGTDSSGLSGGRDGMFGGGGGRGWGGMGGSGGGSIVISGGMLYINSSGDGLDANGTLEITGGFTVVTGPTRGDTATLDYDVSGVITGGTFLGTGASGMAQSFSGSENQGVIAAGVGSAAAGTTITVQDKAGKTILTHTPELEFAVIILSCPEIEKGESYTVTVGSVSGEITAD
ncbi:MAG: carbohydrate-binding domain-containing protein [Clostridia bacterium]|nr:carbohydrate-binding domain-containing protein [Clostridia bacterium]